jgi:hypothetical protein
MVILSPSEIFFIHIAVAVDNDTGKINSQQKSPFKVQQRLFLKQHWLNIYKTA